MEEVIARDGPREMVNANLRYHALQAALIVSSDDDVHNLLSDAKKIEDYLAGKSND